MDHPAKPLAYGDAITHVQAWLDEHQLTEEDRAKGFRWRVYDYMDGDPHGVGTSLLTRPYCGVRVAEVAVSNGRGGASYMQSDAPWALAICAQVERCVLALVEGWNCEPSPETDYEFDTLRSLFTQVPSTP